MKRLFFSQSMLDSMVDAGKIRVEQNTLTMLAGDNPTFRLFPAYRFVKIVNNAPDQAGLVGHFKTEKDLKEMQAEVYMDSVIYRDVAYQADPGYIAEQFVAEKATEEVAEEIDPEQLEEIPSEPDQLSKFILDNLL